MSFLNVVAPMVVQNHLEQSYDTSIRDNGNSCRDASYEPIFVFVFCDDAYQISANYATAVEMDGGRKCRFRRL